MAKQYINIILALSCLLRYWPDQSAIAWCERAKTATQICQSHDGVKAYGFGWVTCNDGFKMMVRDTIVPKFT